MAYATAREIQQSDIPVIDIGSLVADEAGGYARVGAALRDAAESVGFFYIRNHGIPEPAIAEAQATAKQFFAHPLEDKLQVKVDARHRGFIRVGEAKMYESAKVDLKESYIWGLDVGPDDPDVVAGNAMVGPNNWPAFMPALRPALNAYLDANIECGRLMFRAFAASLGLPLDYFVRRYDKPMARGSILYYPPQDAGLGDDQFGVGPHTDYGCLTLLHQDPVGGLQVATRGGEWVMALPIEGTLVVNVGDLLARWSNNHFRSTPHRVVNSAGVARYSMAVFVDPNHDTVVVPACEDEAPLFQPVSVGDYVGSRFDAAFEYRKAKPA